MVRGVWMSPTLFSTKKEPENANAASALARPNPRLTEDQAKTVAFLPEPGEKNYPKCVRMLKEDKEYPKAKVEAPPKERVGGKPKRQRIKIDLQLPIPFRRTRRISFRTLRRMGTRSS